MASVDLFWCISIVFFTREWSTRQVRRVIDRSKVSNCLPLSKAIEYGGVLLWKRTYCFVLCKSKPETTRENRKFSRGYPGEKLSWRAVHYASCSICVLLDLCAIFRFVWVNPYLCVFTTISHLDFDVLFVAMQGNCHSSIVSSRAWFSNEITASIQGVACRS